MSDDPVLPGFEVFKGARRPGRRGGPTPTVRLLAAGIFSLNRTAYEALGRPAAIRYLSNATGDVVIEAAEIDDPAAYPTRSNGSGAQVSARALAGYLGLQGTAVAFSPVTVHEGKLLCQQPKP